MIFVEITAIKLLPKIREFNDVFSELSAETRVICVRGMTVTRNPANSANMHPPSELLCLQLYATFGLQTHTEYFENFTNPCRLPALILIK